MNIFERRVEHEIGNISTGRKTYLFDGFLKYHRCKTKFYKHIKNNGISIENLLSGNLYYSFDHVINNHGIKEALDEYNWDAINNEWKLYILVYVIKDLSIGRNLYKYKFSEITKKYKKIKKHWKWKKTRDRLPTTGISIEYPTYSSDLLFYNGYEIFQGYYDDENHSFNSAFHTFDEIEISHWIEVIPPPDKRFKRYSTQVKSVIEEKQQMILDEIQQSENESRENA
jgi:hypothetical protein